MSLNLNKIKEAYQDKVLERGFKVFDKFFSDYESDKTKVDITTRISEYSKNLGFIFYQQEDNDRSRRYLKIAAEASAYELFYQEPPQIIEHTRTPWEYIEALEIVTSFGSMEDLNMLLDVDEIKFFHGTAEELEECQFLADTAFWLREYLSNETLEKGLIDKLIKLSVSKRIGREEKHFVVPLVNGLKALVEDDRNSWNASIQQALDAHLKEIKSGDYRDDIQGFICMPGMMLIKLGANKGWHTDIDSLYLPKQLMELS
ncbi:MAG: hypothetical protein CMI02_05190 [Oceanospirillaceae bacterium]|nr:hypothetical protein [Oceanospirillaceae bacterium]MBT11414.1 hypothetical protein [Oceanospirillaceae bacterium]|tara:strand:+ start:102563 stop:103339 length:777 start_codon:yes stop_codon:yes gene_type:complete